MRSNYLDETLCWCCQSFRYWILRITWQCHRDISTLTSSALGINFGSCDNALVNRRKAIELKDNCVACQSLELNHILLVQKGTEWFSWCRLSCACIESDWLENRCHQFCVFIYRGQILSIVCWCQCARLIGWGSGVMKVWQGRTW